MNEWKWVLPEEKRRQWMERDMNDYLHYAVACERDTPKMCAFWLGMAYDVAQMAYREGVLNDDEYYNVNKCILRYIDQAV